MEITTGNILFAFAVPLAGLSTGIGSALAFYTKQTDKSFCQCPGILSRRHDLCFLCRDLC